MYFLKSSWNRNALKKQRNFFRTRKSTGCSSLITPSTPSASCFFRKNKHQAFRDFLDDVICNAGVRLLHLLPEDMGMVIDAASRFRLDFDDAYQYGVATKYNLEIVSFGADFDRTERGRKSPGELVSGND
ncbi:PIN domain-containing protein [Candidatus Caldatribacterium saccharofermentans]|uniref:PIN domain-containing protein n=1 Tax=Candidatus Caldatribacterium saccharofermentans TaxID=1454753 RepID=UPI003D0935D3